ncbi:hypothetical protein P4O66_019036 [Electrophorus voltai]|uniref:Uncharacterized protein n=1 Tax=Electrophorus voltai TaxID=2609070 RepID=A0AAD8YRT4_9TELE|nr:hypothetical protein P4O66_019036 [Electrophorus voltai]
MVGVLVLASSPFPAPGVIPQGLWFLIAEYTVCKIGCCFSSVDKAAQICSNLQIQFPTVEHHGTNEEPKDFYVFNDNPNAPTVIHMPLLNASNCKGEVNMWKDRYQTFQSAYDDKMIRDLMVKAGLNITNTKGKLLKEIDEVVKRKKNQ